MLFEPRGWQPLVEKIFRAGCSSYHLPELLDVGACLFCEDERLDVGDHDVCDDDLIDELESLTHAGGTDQRGFAHRVKDRLTVRESLRISTNHDRQVAGLRSSRSA